jgi:fucose permease
MSDIANEAMALNPLKSRGRALASPITSKDPPIELSSNKGQPANSVQDADFKQPSASAEPPTTIPRRNLKLFSAGFSFFVAGTNDGSMGALLPYMLQHYSIGTSFVALMCVNSTDLGNMLMPGRYFATFLGWAVAAATNSHAPKFFNLGALLAIGAFLQLLSQILRPWSPPFPLFVITFFFSGLGQAYQDAHANTFVSSVKGAHNWLGFIHGMYGFGCLVAPFVATAVASAQIPSRWTLFYTFPLGLSVINLISVIIAFRESVNMIKSTASTGTVIEQGGRNKSAMDEVRQMMKLRNLWLISLFFFFYLGVGMTSGGMHVTSTIAG